MSSGGFLRPGSKASSAFGLAFDRPARGDRDDTGDGSRRAKRPREQEHKPPASSSDSDSEGGGEGPSLPSLNPTYRYGDPNLPVSKHRRQILYAVETHATTILVGETGSGKTTQVGIARGAGGIGVARGAWGLWGTVEGAGDAGGGQGSAGGQRLRCPGLNGYVGVEWGGVGCGRWWRVGRGGAEAHSGVGVPPGMAWLWAQSRAPWVLRACT